MSFSLKFFLITLFIILTLTETSDAQVKTWDEMVDSLNQVVNAGQKDSSEVKALYNLAREYMWQQPQKGIDYGNQAVELAQKIGWKKGEAFALYNLGFAFRGKSDFEKTLELHQRTLEIFKEIDYKIGIGKAHFELGYLAFMQSNFAEAEKQLLMALDVEKKLDNKIRQARIISAIGSIHLQKSEFPIALELYEQALQIQEAIGDSENMINSLNKIGSIHLKQKNYVEGYKYFDNAFNFPNAARYYSYTESAIGLGTIAFETNDFKNAIYYYQYALQDAQTDNNTAVIIQIQLKLAEIYFQKKEINKAKEYALALLDLSTKKANKRGIIDSNLLLSRIALKRGEIQTAIKYSTTVLKTSKELTILEPQREAYEILAKSYEQLGFQKKSLDNFKKHIELKDSIFNADKIKELTQIEMKYEFARKQMADSIVFQQQKTILENNLKSERQARWFSLGIAGLLGLLAFGWYRNSQTRKKTNQLLEEKNGKIELLLKEIHHRVKNNLQTISSLLFLQSAHIKDAEVKEAVAEGQHRVESMALIHQKLYQRDNLAGIEMKDYLTNLGNSLIDTFVNDPDRISLKVDMDEHELDVDTAVPLGLIANELITNSIKYAFPDDRKGEIQLKVFNNSDGKLELFVADNGVGDANTKTGTAFGSQLINLLTKQLNGSLEQGTEDGFWTRVVV